MARAGLNKFNVQQARDTLLARGINPSVDAVRVELGNTGSKTTIHRYLKELEAEDATQLGDEALLSSALKDMIARMAAKLRDEALQRAEAANNAWQTEKTQLVAQLSAAQARLKELGADNSALASRLERESAVHDETKTRLHQSELRAERFEQQVKGLEQQLDENQKHLASLEEKHRNSRDALEHFRTSAQEQRQQEQLRHDTQVQQLQAEIRNLNQTLIVKQSELTQLNRDNASLVGEVGEHRKQAKQLEKSLSEKTKQADLASDTNTKLLAVTEEKNALDSRLQSLSSTLETELEKNMAMVLSLAKLQTELDVKNALLEKLSIR
ncbi:Cointegrate resolution protein T [gamma proteobacterium HdN1]|jgi:chromosome segregation ATPase|nr:Cointegrate resolution protein T [gamma proteobacterium HdN1]